MGQDLVLSGVDKAEFGQSLRASFIRTRPRVVGVAAAFVSIEGVRQLIETLRRCGEPDCRLIAGTDNAVTHPQALYAARDQGWSVRLGQPNRGIFHPKLIVGGREFRDGGMVYGVCCTYIGSSNLTNGGLKKNVECGLISDAGDCPDGASTAFAQLWNLARRASAAELRNYAARFAERARNRTPRELAELGVNDSRPLPTGVNDLRINNTQSEPALGSGFAIAAWAGLQSFTGEYRFQIEFPRDAGKVINRLIRNRAQADGTLDVYCPDDETTRRMQFRYYNDNGMFRLNVQNDVPGVAWARANRAGIAMIEQGPVGGAPLRIRLLQPGTETDQVVGRSAILGTWGRTSTRAYGWF